MGYEALIMYVAMFYIAVWLICLKCDENKEPKMDDIGVIFGGIEFTQMANNFQI